MKADGKGCMCQSVYMCRKEDRTKGDRVQENGIPSTAQTENRTRNVDMTLACVGLGVRFKFHRPDNSDQKLHDESEESDQDPLRFFTSQAVGDSAAMTAQPNPTCGACRFACSYRRHPIERNRSIEGCDFVHRMWSRDQF